MNLPQDTRDYIARTYAYLVNYDSADPQAPIDPLEYKDSSGDSLLLIAAQRGDIRTVRAILEAGTDVNQRGDMGCTALHHAVHKGHREVVEVLVKAGASESLQDDFGHTPMETQQRVG